MLRVRKQGFSLMSRMHFVAGAVLASLPVTLAQGQPSTKTYTYDELGRLITVEVANGSQNGERRDYTYDRANNRMQVNSTGATGGPPPANNCALSSVGWTTLQGSYGIARIFPPTPAGCGFPVKLSFTIDVESGSVTSQELAAIRAQAFWIGGDTLQATDFAKSMAINASTTQVASNQPYVLKVTWSAPDGNATFDSPGPPYALVTVNPN